MSLDEQIRAVERAARIDPDVRSRLLAALGVVDGRVWHVWERTGEYYDDVNYQVVGEFVFLGYGDALAYAQDYALKHGYVFRKDCSDSWDREPTLVTPTRRITH